MADIFVSYTSSDRDWAFWIGHELIALGHTPHIHEWEIAGGGDIMKWMDERHDAADHVLCVVSEKYLKAAYSSLERLCSSMGRGDRSAELRASGLRRAERGPDIPRALETLRLARCHGE